MRRRRFNRSIFKSNKIAKFTLRDKGAETLPYVMSHADITDYMFNPAFVSRVEHHELCEMANIVHFYEGMLYRYLCTDMDRLRHYYYNYTFYPALLLAQPSKYELLDAIRRGCKKITTSNMRTLMGDAFNILSTYSPLAMNRYSNNYNIYTLSDELNYHKDEICEIFDALPSLETFREYPMFNIAACILGYRHLVMPPKTPAEFLYINFAKICEGDFSKYKELMAMRRSTMMGLSLETFIYTTHDEVILSMPFRLLREICVANNNVYRSLNAVNFNSRLGQCSHDDIYILLNKRCVSEIYQSSDWYKKEGKEFSLLFITMFRKYHSAIHDREVYETIEQIAHSEYSHKFKTTITDHYKKITEKNTTAPSSGAGVHPEYSESAIRRKLICNAVLYEAPLVLDPRTDEYTEEGIDLAFVSEMYKAEPFISYRHIDLGWRDTKMRKLAAYMRSKYKNKPSDKKTKHAKIKNAYSSMYKLYVLVEYLLPFVKDGDVLKEVFASIMNMDDSIRVFYMGLLYLYMPRHIAAVIKMDPLFGKYDSSNITLTPDNYSEVLKRSAIFKSVEICSVVFNKGDMYKQFMDIIEYIYNNKLALHNAQYEGPIIFSRSTYSESRKYAEDMGCVLMKLQLATRKYAKVIAEINSELKTADEPAVVEPAAAIEPVVESVELADAEYSADLAIEPVVESVELADADIFGYSEVDTFTRDAEMTQIHQDSLMDMTSEMDVDYKPFRGNPVSIKSHKSYLEFLEQFNITDNQISAVDYSAAVQPDGKSNIDDMVDNYRSIYDFDNSSNKELIELLCDTTNPSIYDKIQYIYKRTYRFENFKTIVQKMKPPPITEAELRQIISPMFSYNEAMFIEKYSPDGGPTWFRDVIDSTRNGIRQTLIANGCLDILLRYASRNDDKIYREVSSSKLFMVG
jgi:hypothetical protein